MQTHRSKQSKVKRSNQPTMEISDVQPSGCLTCFGRGYYLCNEGDVKCKFCNGTGMKPIVLATGVYDLVHAGHISLLEFAALYGDLWVGINDDESVRKLKGPSRPINNEANRAYVISAVKAVQGVFLIHSTTITDTIIALRPSVWVKGNDYQLETLNKEERAAANAVGTKILFAPKIEGLSSSGILAKI